MEGLQEAVEAGAKFEATHAIERRLATSLDDAAEQLLKETVDQFEEAGEDYVLKEVQQDIFDRVSEELVQREFSKQARGISTRDFKLLDDDFIEYARHLKHGELGGGLRLTMKPLGRGKGGVTIPGTRGLGKAITRKAFGTPIGSAYKEGVGTGLRGALDGIPNLRLTERWRDVWQKFGIEGPMIRGFAEGKPGTAAMFRGLQDAKTQAQLLGVKVEARKLANVTGEAQDVFRREMLSPDEADELLALAMQPSAGGFLVKQGDIIPHSNPAVQEAVNKMAKGWSEVFESMHAKAKALGMDMGKLQNYVPLVKSKNLINVFKSMQSKSVAIVIPPGATGDELLGYQLLSEMYAAWLRKETQAGTTLAQSQFMKEKLLGKTINGQAVEISAGMQELGGQTTLIHALHQTDIEHLGHIEMNRLMTNALNDVIETNLIPVKKGFSALETNPYEIANQYFNSMNEAMTEAVLVKTLKAYGLIDDATFERDLGRMIAQMRERINELPKSLKRRIEKELLIAERGSKAVREIVENPAEGIAREGRNVLRPHKRTKMVTVKVGKDKISLPEHVVADPRAQQVIAEANAYAKQWDVSRKAMREDRNRRVKALQKQGLSREVSKAIADETIFDHVDEVFRVTAAIEREQATVLAAAYAEMTARQVAKGGGAEKVALRNEASQKAAHYQAKADAREALSNARARLRAASGTSPTNVVAFDTPEATRAFAERLVPYFKGKVGALAVEADNLPKGEKLAAALRQIGEELEGLTGYSEDSINKIGKLIVRAKALMDVMYEGKSVRLSFEGWVATRPPRGRAMGKLEQERVMDEWLQLGSSRHIPPIVDAASGIDDDAAREAWFESFKEMNGVDLRALSAQDRKHLKTLLQDVPPDSAQFTAHDAARGRILAVDTGRSPDLSMKRTIQNMFLDLAEGYSGKGAGRGARTPKWAKIDIAEARDMDPLTFFATYHEEFGEAILTDIRFQSIQDAANLLYDKSFIGRNIDEALSASLAEDLEVLTYLNAGRSVWMDPRKRGILQRMFDESGMSAEYTLHGAPGGRFRMESIEQTEHVSMQQLERELALAGFKGDAQGAAKALADGTLKPGTLSKGAINTLTDLPKSDQILMDNLSARMRIQFKSVFTDEAKAAGRTVVDAQKASNMFKRIETLLQSVGADGNIRPAALRELQALVEVPANWTAMRKMIPPEEWALLDNIRNTVAHHAAWKAAPNKEVKRALSLNKSLREDFLFDTAGAMDRLQQIEQEFAQAATDATLEGYEGTVELFKEIGRVLNELYGVAPDSRTGLTSPVWATEQQLDYVNKLLQEGQELADRLGVKGDEKLSDIFAWAEKRGGLVPTADHPDFLPVQAFGLGGKGLKGKVIQADVGVFVENTMRTMMAMQTPAGLQAYATGMRRALNWWKGMATVARPTFHVRNAMSAFWNNTMIDVRMQDYGFVAKHMPELRNLHKATNDWVTAADGMADPLARFYFKEAAKAGLFDSTFSNQEILRKLAKEAATSRTSKYNPLSSAGPLIQAGGYAMENIENYFRLAAFIRHMPAELMGETDDALLRAGAGYANDMVNMVHFDYASLTNAEEHLKNFIPFFVWTRRNMPLQMRALVEQPRMIARYNHLLQVGNDMSDSRDDQGPRKYGGQAFIGTDMYLNEDTPFWAQLILDPDIPVKDLFEIDNPLSPASYLNLLTGMLGPQIQEPLKIAFQDSYQTTAPTGWTGITRAVKAVLDGEADINTNPRIDSRVASIMKLVFPPASEYLTAFEQDPTRMQAQGIVKGDIGSRARAGIMDLTLPGVGFSSATPASEYSVYQSSIFSGRDILTELRKQGIITLEDDESYDAWAKSNP